MTYNTKYILSYCNKQGVSLRIELQMRDYVGEAFLIVNEDEYLQDEDGAYIVQNIDGSYNPDRDKNLVEGGANPFELRYRNDSGLKGGVIRATEANLQFFEDLVFNIDDLATSDETQLRVVFYFNDEIEWIGFATPDFFSTEITSSPLINITASDRIGILKDVDYVIDDIFTEERINYLDILQKCLSYTGLDLNINILCDFMCTEFEDVNNSPFKESFVSELRFLKNEDSGDTMDCYTIIRSICDVFNCFITQYKGEWWIVNKEQWELGIGNVYTYAPDGEEIGTRAFNASEFHFNLIDMGSVRTVMPTHAKNTILLEHGDDINYPKNRTFKLVEGTRPGWTNVGGLPVVNTNEIPYEYDPTDASIVSSYEDSREWLKLTQSRKILEFWNGFENVHGIDFHWPHLVSDPFKLPTLGSKTLTMEVVVKAIGRPFTNLSVMVTMEFTDVQYSFFSLMADGKFYREDRLITPDMPNYYTTKYLKLDFEDKYGVDNIAAPIDAKITVNASAGSHQGNLNLDNAIFKVWVFPTTHWNPDVNFNPHTIVKEITVDFISDNQVPKGTIFQNKIVGDFTKTPETINSLFGDYQTNGQNGFFYKYREDSLSIHYNALGIRLKNWYTPNDLELNPVLIHALRQPSRSYGEAHDELRI
ncbi:MAG: hypothetical protein ACI35Z_08515, partial [Sphingobacterium hotanense]